MRRFLTRRLLVAYACVAVLIGTGAFVWARQGGAAVQYRTAAATLGTVTQSVSVSGNLASASESDLDFGASGKVTAVSVTPGQQVTAGETLATLDSTSQQASLAQAQATLSSAQAKLTLDEQGATAANLESARAQVSSAQISLQNAQTSYTDTVAVNTAAVNQAQQQLQSDQTAEQNDCNSNASSSQCSSDQQKVSSDNANLQSTEARAQQSNDQALAQVRSAQVQLVNAQAALSVLEQGTTPQQIQQDQAQVQIDQISVTSAQTALSGATITAPVGGTVEEVNVTVGQQVSNGSSSNASSSSSTTHSIVLITPGLFQVTGSVSDAQVNEIALGQSAQVVPAGSQEAVTGKVTSVAAVATVTSGVATFPVTVTLNGVNNSLRAGMSASVSIVVNQVVQVLTVPTSAVHTTSAGSTVEVLVGGQPQTVPVTVGASDANRTQILSGVNLGDQVVIATITGTVPTSGTGSGGGRFGGGGLGGGGGVVFGGGGAGRGGG